MKQVMISVVVKLVLPGARRWVDRQEARIRAEGVELSRSQSVDAVRAGVNQPAAVRVMRVPAIPRPLDPFLRRLNRWTALISDDTAGIALGHGVFICESCWNDRALLVHELVHVAQYERLGGTRPFLKAYLHECLTLGYPNGPLEQEAIHRAASICAAPTLDNDL